MKKIISIAVLSAAALTLASCGGHDTEAQNTTTVTSNTVSADGTTTTERSQTTRTAE